MPFRRRHRTRKNKVLRGGTCPCSAATTTASKPPQLPVTSTLSQAGGSRPRKNKHRQFGGDTVPPSDHQKGGYRYGTTRNRRRSRRMRGGASGGGWTFTDWLLGPIGSGNPVTNFWSSMSNSNTTALSNGNTTSWTRLLPTSQPVTTYNTHNPIKA